MVVIDPLRRKIHTLLREGQANPLNQARLRFGTQHDIDDVFDVFRKSGPDPRRYVYIDLTPFDRIGRVVELVARLDTVPKLRPVLMIMSADVMDELRRGSRKIPVPVVKFTASGALERIIGGGRKDVAVRRAVKNDFAQFSRHLALKEFRSQISERILTELLFQPECLVFPRDHRGFFQTHHIAAKPYLSMPNGMLVSCYLNLKEIGKDNVALTHLIYEIISVLTQNFRRDIDALSEFDTLVVPNNTALFLAAGIQAVIEKPVICIDRLGPIPSLNLQISNLAGLLRGKRVILIEEVVAAGNEVDRTILVLSQLEAKLVSIITLYNLEVGLPMLVKQGQMISLCKPKTELQYEYRSK